MKAAQINQYGGPEVVEINPNALKPSLKSGQILVENFAASINAIDWKLRAGRLQAKAPLPMPITLGGDFAGKVVAVADGVTEFKLGDEVYGQAIVLNGGSGSMAEFVTANAKNTGFKPKLIRFEEAASLPLAGVSAVQAVEEHLQIQKGQKILIHGGAGGVGHFAIQVAKAHGAYVVTTVKTEDIEFVKSLGADEVINYETHHFEKSLKNFDAVFDTVGGEVTNKSFQVLKKGGIIVSMVGEPSQELAKTADVTAIGQKTKTTSEHLQRLTEMVESGQVVAQVDKIFALEQTADAFTYQEKIHPNGKVVVTIR